MTSNKLKIIACISMLVDHIGFLLFPQIQVLRYIGRIALPIFAYFIAQGCIHTLSRRKYFLSVLTLALLCQIVYFVEGLINGGIRTVDLNILFTFALSIVICSSYLALTQQQSLYPRKVLNAAFFAGALAISVFLCVFLNRLSPIPINFDYGIAGVLLPLFAVISVQKEKQLPLFFIGLVLFNIVMAEQLSYTWYSFLSIPLLLAYNGKRGTRRLKYFFYLFYPLHFAAIYLIKLIAF